VWPEDRGILSQWCSSPSRNADLVVSFTSIMENQSAQQSFQPNEDSRSPEIQTGVAKPANGDDYWYPLLEKTLQEAYQRLGS